MFDLNLVTCSFWFSIVLLTSLLATFLFVTVRNFLKQKKFHRWLEVTYNEGQEIIRCAESGVILDKKTHKILARPCVFHFLI